MEGQVSDGSMTASTGQYQVDPLTWMLAVCVKRLGGQVRFTDADDNIQGMTLTSVGGHLSDEGGVLVTLHPGRLHYDA